HRLHRDRRELHHRRVVRRGRPARAPRVGVVSMAASSTISPALEITAAEPRWGSRVIPVVRRLARNPLSLLSVLIIAGCIVVALLAPWLAPYDYKDQDILARLQGQSREHLLGTDDLGRDILSRIIWGSRVSITVSFGAVAVGVTLGTLIGLCAGYF